MTTQSCKGCQFLVHKRETAYLCRATDHTDAPLPLATDQRALGAACGPEALLYAPTRWYRIRTWWSNGPI